MTQFQDGILENKQFFFSLFESSRINWKDPARIFSKRVCVVDVITAATSHVGSSNHGDDDGI